MFEGKTILALIPARGGSKGLPGKNLLPLGGKPMIAWTIEAALGSSYIDATLVSTDCPQIAAAALQHGAQVPFMRPPELATDDAKVLDTVHHALKWRQENGYRDDLVILLQPTSPLRTSRDIDSGIALLFARHAEAVVSVCEAEHPPWWTGHLPEDGSMADFLPKGAVNRNRQELPDFFRLNGALYISYADFLTCNGSFYGPRTYAHVMPRERSIDVDSKLDFLLAGLLLNET